MLGDTAAPSPITTAPTPNDVTSTRWQRPYPGYFGFTFAQWFEVETRRPSLYSVYGVERGGVFNRPQINT